LLVLGAELDLQIVFIWVKIDGDKKSIRIIILGLDGDVVWVVGGVLCGDPRGEIQRVVIRINSIDGEGKNFFVVIDVIDFGWVGVIERGYIIDWSHVDLIDMCFICDTLNVSGGVVDEYL